MEMRTLLIIFVLTCRLLALDVYPSPGNLDPYWQQYCGKGTTFHYVAGDYYTTGGNFLSFASMQSGDHHIGAGIDKTVIHLVGAHLKTVDGRIFAGYGRWVSNWSCSFLTLDCNATSQPKWFDSTNQASIGAVSCWGGDHITMEQVKVIGFGTPVAGSECFPVSFFANGTLPASGKPATMDYILVQDCIFEGPVTGNKDGCTIVGMVDDVPAGVYLGPNCLVNNCYFLNCKSDFSYVHCVGVPRVTHCYATNSGTFWSAEPTRVIYPHCGVFIDNNTALGADYFLRIKTHPGGEIGDATQGADFSIGPNNVTKEVYP
jgi:hypothetical protein